MKLSPALEFEKLREDAESWNKIFLHKDGKFFRAYEWSAWLIKTVVCTEEFQKERGGQKATRSTARVDSEGSRVGMFQILSQVMSYPLESKTPSDNAEFIASLKRQLAALL